MKALLKQWEIELNISPKICVIHTNLNKQDKLPSVWILFVSMRLRIKSFNVTEASDAKSSSEVRRPKAQKMKVNHTLYHLLS